MYWIQYEGIDERYVNRNEYIYIFFLNRNEQVNWVIALKTAGGTVEGGEREREIWWNHQQKPGGVYLQNFQILHILHKYMVYFFCMHMYFIVK